ncbi:sporulation protein [Virgibacillus dokdonensis]|uniref:sporulation protein n=1 Tax=Virgibacillus dokdonensis TaxID=302167 RepID=UPI00098A1DD9|nr:sporulation protein [Virgibacillus dokdonensis]
MFKKLFHSIGIGSAQVDAKIDTEDFKPGETVEGVLDIEGGNSEQRIDQVYVTVATNYTSEIGDNEDDNVRHVLGRFKLTDEFVIQEGEKKSIPFSFQLPVRTPATLGKTRVWLETGMDIKKALDPRDKDHIHVDPHPLVDAFLDAADSFGLELKEVECEFTPISFGLRKEFPIVQEFEFKPEEGKYKRKLDELEALFFVYESEVVAVIEVDRKMRNDDHPLAENFDLDESNVVLRYGFDDVDDLPEKLEALIEKNL